MDGHCGQVEFLSQLELAWGRLRTDLEERRHRYGVFEDELWHCCRLVAEDGAYVKVATNQSDRLVQVMWEAITASYNKRCGAPEDRDGQHLFDIECLLACIPDAKGQVYLRARAWAIISQELGDK